jgi:carbon starvation protein CstA
MHTARVQHSLQQSLWTLTISVELFIAGDTATASARSTIKEGFSCDRHTVNSTHLLASVFPTNYLCTETPVSLTVTGYFVANYRVDLAADHGNLYAKALFPRSQLSLPDTSRTC